MSILDPNSYPRSSEEEVNAEMIKRTSADLARRIFRSWEQNYDALWNSSNPEAVLTELGTDAAEVFRLSSQIISLMESTMPEALPDDWKRISNKIQNIPKHQINEDGSVYLIVPEVDKDEIEVVDNSYYSYDDSL